MALSGYNVAFKIGGKTIVGRTQDDLTIAARVKESLTKDDQGDTQREVTGHDVTFKASALMVVNNSDSTKLDRDDVMALALAKGTSAVVAVTYEATGGDTYGGNAIITNYTESSNASDDATLSIDFQITGAFAIVTSGTQSNP